MAAWTYAAGGLGAACGTPWQGCWDGNPCCDGTYCNGGTCTCNTPAPSRLGATCGAWPCQCDWWLNCQGQAGSCCLWSAPSYWAECWPSCSYNGSPCDRPDLVCRSDPWSSTGFRCLDPLPPSPPPPAALPPPPATGYRLDAALLSDRNAFPRGDLYLTALVQSFTSMQSVWDRCGYQAVAGIHGRQVCYDGYCPGRFCVHGSRTFLPWHRAYMCHIETCMINHCQWVAERYQNWNVRGLLQNRICPLLRMPYWRWTIDGTMPSILTDATLPILNYDGSVVDVANPFAGFGPEGTWRASWSVYTCSREIGQFLAAASSFNGRSGRCTYTGGRNGLNGCAGNLEDCHNGIHDDVGGTMADVPTSASDPVFFFHHSYVDYLGWQFQVAGGGGMEYGGFVPFPDYGSTLGLQCGGRAYDYWDSRTVNPYAAIQAGGSAAAAGAAANATGAAAAAAVAAYDHDAPPPPQAAPAAVVAAAVSELLGGYSGYSWQYVREGVVCRQEAKPWTMYALLRGTRVPTAPGGAVDVAALQRERGYCGRWSAFSCIDDMYQGDAEVVVSFDLTGCLAATGRDPDVAPADPAHPEAGPASAPITPQDVRLVVVDHAKRDITRRFKVPPGAELRWALVYSQATGQQAAAAAAEQGGGSGPTWGFAGGRVGQAAAAAASPGGNSTNAASSP